VSGKRDKINSTPAFCSVPDCGKPVAARGFCASHYERARRRGSFGFRERPPRPIPTPEQVIADAEEAYAELVRHLELEKEEFS
jgi:hypothetical protein